MTFLAPLMLIGVIAIAVPIGVHLIGRARARQVDFAALEFLAATRRRTARRLRLREHALLVVRVLACVAIPLVLAKPLVTCQRARPQVAGGPQAAVLIIDDGLASGYVDGGERALDRIVAHARELLRQLGPEAEVAVIRAAEGAPPPIELSRDHLRQRDRLGELTPSPRPADLRRALGRAAQLLAGSSHAQQTVFLLSPLAASTFSGGPPPWGEDGPRLTVFDPLAGRPRPNLGVTRVEVEREASSGPRGIAVMAEIGNFSASDAVGVEVSLRVGERVVARGAVDVPAGERRRKRFQASLPEGARLADAAVELPRDALAVDDLRHVRTALPPRIRAILVDGDPRTSRHDDELFYLRAALRPGDRDDGIDLDAVTPDELDGLDLAQADVIVLANVAALPAARAAALAAWVRGGGGLWVTAGDRVDAAAYARTMALLVPRTLADPIDLRRSGGATDGGGLRLTKWDRTHPIFAALPPGTPTLAEARFAKVALVGPAAGDERQVLARFDDGAAALIEGALGQGRLLFWASTLDRDWTDLPIHPGYVAFVHGVIRHLARTGPSPSGADHLVGRTVMLPVGDRVRLEVVRPDGEVTTFDRAALAGRQAVRFDETGAPGIYRVRGVDAAGGSRPLDELSFAVNVDPRGSDLTPLAATALSFGQRERTADASTTVARVELWHAVAAALLLLLLLEGLLTRR